MNTDIIRDLCLAKEYDKAAALLATELGTSKPAAMSGVQFCQLALHTYLCRGEYETAAELLWTPDKFTRGPRSTQMLWEAAKSKPKVLVLGASSMSKTYTIGVFLFLDWLRDPECTTVKLISMSSKHASGNLFSHLVDLHQSASIPLVGEIKTNCILIDGKDERKGISTVAIPEGSKNARLRGYHPPKRNSEHPLFGINWRLIIFLDEAENIPEQVWVDLSNLLASASGSVKVFAATNPTNPQSEFGRQSEPPEGWGKFGMDREQWESKRGWHTIWLDASKCENVVARKKIFHGLQEWEGYMDIIRQRGENTPGYWSMARGMYPPAGVASSVIPNEFVHKNKGEWMFESITTPVGSVDLACKGGDKVVFSYGRFGKAYGWKDADGIIHRCKPQNALQIEGQFTVDKGAVPNAVEISDQIINYCKTLGIESRWLALDTTGLGQPFADYIGSAWNDGALEINYAGKATESRITAEDSMNAYELYRGITSELWFAGRRWFELGAIKLSNCATSDTVEKELIGRKFHDNAKGTKLRVESKDDYKARGNSSPDFADSLLMLIQLVRTRAGWLPGVLEEQAMAEPVDNFLPKRKNVLDEIDDITSDTTAGSTTSYEE